MTTTINANGNTYTDDSDPSTGMGNGGWRKRLMPMLGDVMEEVAAIEPAAAQVAADRVAVAADRSAADAAAGTAATKAGEAVAAANSAAAATVGKADGDLGNVTNAAFAAKATAAGASGLPAATQAEVNAASSASKAVTPATLAGYATGGSLRLGGGFRRVVAARSNTGTALTLTTENVQRYTHTGNATITLPTVTLGSTEALLIDVELLQDATGGRTVTWAAPAGETLEWSGATVAPDIITTANKRNRWKFKKFGGETVWTGSLVSSAPLVSTVTMNPSDKASGISLSASYLAVGTSGGGGCVRANKALGTGKFYFEGIFGGVAGSAQTIGVITGAGSLTSWIGGVGGSTGFATDGGNLWVNGGSSGLGSSPTTGSVVMVAVDTVAGKIWFGVNGVWLGSGNPATGANPASTLNATSGVFPAVGISGSSVALAWTMCFASYHWNYAAPSGFGQI